MSELWVGFYLELLVSLLLTAFLLIILITNLPHLASMPRIPDLNWITFHYFQV